MDYHYGMYVTIPQGIKHRVENKGNENAVCCNCKAFFSVFMPDISRKTRKYCLFCLLEYYLFEDCERPYISQITEEKIAN